MSAVHVEEIGQILLYQNIAKDDALPHDLVVEIQKLEDKQPSSRVPRCTFPDTLADSAFNRMTTEECRKQLEDVACEMDPVGWPVHAIENSCSKFDKSIHANYKGCYEDGSKKRILRGFKYDFTDSNSPQRCIQHCLRIGFQLAVKSKGVEYKSECFCGSLADLESGNLHESQLECERYKCPGNESLTCGGFNAIAVYTTGVIHNSKPIPSYIEPENSVRDVRILFLLQLNGRNSRQIRRLLRLIYNPRHFYFVHVDPRQKYMQQEMIDIQELLQRQGITNFHVSDKRFPTIWGGSSLLEMFLYVIQWTLAHPAFQKWDYIFNLSESDFPVLSLMELEAILTANKGKTFISSHGYNTGTFLKKQGYNYHFMQCENRMWRFSGRTNYPNFLRVDGGSDWVIIDRNFAKFAISELELPSRMRKLFTSILLPLEGFFHTLSLNSNYCEQVMYNNLRLTNWKRSQGCRCGALKQVVDWCGCSPLALLHNEEKYELNNTIAKVNYFAHNSTLFQYSNLARVLFEESDLDGNCGFTRLNHIHVYKATLKSELFLVFNIQDACGREHELLVSREHHGQVYDGQVADGFELKLIEFGMNLDLKEEIFRDFVSLPHRNATVVFQFQWYHVADPHLRLNKTSPWAIVQVVSTDGKVLKKERVQPYDSIDNMQHVMIDLKKIKSLTPGFHKMVVSSHVGSQRFGVIDFPIFPSDLDSEFRELVKRFYTIKSTCSAKKDRRTVGAVKCTESTWSTLYPDQKQQISVGFDEAANTLN
ncbi:Cyclin and Carbohydrate-binding WSC and Glycosyl transferase domain containing protein [Aphelenchoides besseyi]|nr:Cyclin and Carbohydrate-binding WSC and Glycosyl transferase domain containing protein [Aphelenchoides besseyi]